MKNQGKLCVISAPSGAGKTTLISRVLDRFSDLSYSISHTTRSPRKGEVQARDYFFTDEAQFKDLIASGQMLEWAKVHGNYYGTSLSFVKEKLGAGQSILLDIDVQGAEQVMASGLPMTSIFIMPPSVQVLKQRLNQRGTESAEVIARRLKNAKAEMEKRSEYDYLVVNDDLEEAAQALNRIFTKELDRPDDQE